MDRDAISIMVIFLFQQSALQLYFQKNFITLYYDTILEGVISYLMLISLLQCFHIHSLFLGHGPILMEELYLYQLNIRQQYFQISFVNKEYASIIILVFILSLQCSQLLYFLINQLVDYYKNHNLIFTILLIFIIPICHYLVKYLNIIDLQPTLQVFTFCFKKNNMRRENHLYLLLKDRDATKNLVLFYQQQGTQQLLNLQNFVMMDYDTKILEV